ncbi:MAG: hypothetical protein E6J89_06430 [Deltaproteobacteria bacterium]|nr:MAG: hypothetical protein E6J89_06430 [Deltaproteobacteria bacterium]
MKANHNERMIDTTLGEVIAAVSEAAFECSKNSTEAYILAGFVLEEIFRKSPTVNGPQGLTLNQVFPREGYLN